MVVAKCGMAKAMNSKNEILAPGRYVGRASCHSNNGDWVCKDDKSHFGADDKHLDVVVNYHVPQVGVITIRASSEKEADILSRIKIYEALTKVYLAHMKQSLVLEALLKEVS